MNLGNIDDRTHQKLSSGAHDGGDAHHNAILGIFHKTARDVNANGDRDEFFQLTQAAELSQHDLAEHEFAGSGAQGGGQRVKQHGQCKGDKQEILHGEFYQPNLELGDQLGEQRSQSIQRHGQDKDHQFL